jgi:hypothetical protein
MDGKKKHRSSVNFTQNLTLKQRDLQSGHQNLIYSLLVGKWKNIINSSVKYIRMRRTAGTRMDYSRCNGE